MQFIFSRNRSDWTSRLPHIADAVRSLAAEALILDGELLANGLNFYDISKAMRRKEVFVYVFDILHLDGHDLRLFPLLDRKQRLADTIVADPHLLVSEFFDDGEVLFAACTKEGKEGVVSMRKDLPYKSGKCLSWRKSKCSAWRKANKERYKLFER